MKQTFNIFTTGSDVMTALLSLSVNAPEFLISITPEEIKFIVEMYKHNPDARLIVFW